MKAFLPTDACPCGSGLSYAACHRAIDRRIADARARGERTPTRAMIKTPSQIEGCREAGRVNAQVLDAVSRMIAPGVSTADIDRVVREQTRALGGVPACLGFEGFPAAVCTSVNSVVCHGIPSPDEILREGDIVNVDCTTRYRGYYGDASRMYKIGQVSPRAEQLVRTTQEAVRLCVSHLRPFSSHLGDIGYDISTYVRRRGFSVVREIGGHGVGLRMHEDPYVCHVGLHGSGIVLLPGMIFTIEPMINEGTSRVLDNDKDGWTIRTADGKLSAQVEYEVLVTEDSVAILSC